METFINYFGFFISIYLGLLVITVISFISFEVVFDIINKIKGKKEN